MVRHVDISYSDNIKNKKNESERILLGIQNYENLQLHFFQSWFWIMKVWYVHKNVFSNLKTSSSLKFKVLVS